MDAPELLVVVTHRAWLVDAFTQASPIRVVGDVGLDAPDVSGPVAWWAPMAHAARLQRAGVPVTLAAPGPDWLSRVPADLLGRPVWTGTLADYAEGAGPDAGWSKPAEFKAELFPAAWRPSRTSAVDEARAAGVPDGSVVQVTDVTLDLEAEFRVFAADGQAVAVSAYLDSSGSTWSPDWQARTDLDVRGARAFAQSVLDEVPTPAGAVVDVAFDRQRGWLVLEANPAWSSNPYGADMAGVTRAVLAANRPDAAWAWAPDPYVTAQADRMRLLPRCRPAWSLRGR